MAQTLHAQYKEQSPYYRGILDQWGRWLTYSQVAAILDEHSLRDQWVSENGTPPAAAETDALVLVQWLGY